jgi:hypothetical protein
VVLNKWRKYTICATYKSVMAAYQSAQRYTYKTNILHGKVSHKTAGKKHPFYTQNMTVAFLINISELYTTKRRNNTQILQL